MTKDQLGKTTFIIPARMESTRFPNKPLKTLKDRPVIDWVYQNCLKSKYCKDAIIATDSNKIIKYCEETSTKYVITGEHNCASNRVAEASKEIESNWIVEVQGDEPLLWAEIMDSWLTECLKLLDQTVPDLFLSIATLNSNIVDSPNFVKVITDNEGKLLWASRSRIPSNVKGVFHGKYYRHTGFHLWKKSSLLKFSNIEPSHIEISEDTHATRIVENNFYAHTIRLPETQAIDVPEDLNVAEMILTDIIKI